MRCSKCGLPLSPTRTSCPRCGTSIAEKAETYATRPFGGQSSIALGTMPAGVHVDSSEPHQLWGEQLPATPWEAPGSSAIQNAPPYSPLPPSQASDAHYPQWAFPGQETSLPTENAIPFSPAASTLTSQSGPSWAVAGPSTPANTPSPMAWGAPPAQQQDTPQPMLPGSPVQTLPRGGQFPTDTLKRSMQFGFTLSGACMLIASIILIIVQFISLGLPPITSQSKTPLTPHTQVTPITTPLPQASPTSTTNYPAQQFIDEVQISDEYNATTAVRPTTFFKVSQRVYVTFSVHPGKKAGAVCLLWFINNTQFSHYEFTVLPNTVSAYSFATLKKSGEGYVQLYWASSTTCADKQLAQQVNFTVAD